MENATEAIMMAASVLLLIIALSVSISSFSKIKGQVEDMTSESETVLYTTDSSGNYYSFISSSDEDVRTVGTDAIIAALRRMRKEFYTIYIIDTHDKTWLNPILSDNTFKTMVVKAKQKQEYLLKNKKDTIDLVSKDTNILELSMSYQQIIYNNRIKTSSGETRTIQALNQDLLEVLYKMTSGKKYKEYIGVYQEKLDGVADVNKGRPNKILTFVRE